MKSTYMIKEFSSNDLQFVIHIINFSDEHKKGWYTQVSAAEGMIERASKRWFYHWNKKSDKFKTSVKFDRWQSSDEKKYLKMQSDSIKNYGKIEGLSIYPKFTKINHESIWDFFDYINYDHKNKKVSNTDTLIHIKSIK